LGSKSKIPSTAETEIAGLALKLIRPVEKPLGRLTRALMMPNPTRSKSHYLSWLLAFLVQQMVDEHLGQAPVDGVQPDLCVVGAALQAGVLWVKTLKPFFGRCHSPLAGHFGSSQYSGHHAGILWCNYSTPTASCPFRLNLFPLSPNQTAEIEIFQGRK